MLTANLSFTSNTRSEAAGHPDAEAADRQGLGSELDVVGYALAQAYRSVDAATIAPFEYTVLPMSIFWGWVMFGHFPDHRVLAGITMIAVAGVYVFMREKRRRGPSPVPGRCAACRFIAENRRLAAIVQKTD